LPSLAAYAHTAVHTHITQMNTWALTTLPSSPSGKLSVKSVRRTKVARSKSTRVPSRSKPMPQLTSQNLATPGSGCSSSHNPGYVRTDSGKPAGRVTGRPHGRRRRGSLMFQAILRR
jgi:hypothetical protein